MVYRPREDSYLLKKRLADKNLEDKKVLDMGTGSGILAVQMAGKGAEVVASDIEDAAIDYAEKRAEEEGLRDSIKFLKSDLFENIDKNYEFDLIVFNPPYLPSGENIEGQETWDGGEKGVETTERFLKSAGDYLDDEGEALVILSSRSDIEELIEKFELNVVEEQKTWFEKLYIGKFG